MEDLEILWLFFYFPFGPYLDLKCGGGFCTPIGCFEGAVSPRLILGIGWATF